MTAATTEMPRLRGAPGRHRDESGAKWKATAWGRLRNARLDVMVALARRGWKAGRAPGCAVIALLAMVAGCANPGPPKPPSLHLPSPPRDLSASRTGDRVELRFTAPKLSTDKAPLPGTTLRGTFCRQLADAASCDTPAGAGGSFPLLDAAGHPTVVVWQDVLPPELTSGEHRFLRYRVELFNAGGRSAGVSDPAYTVAGAAPDAVRQLAARGSRRGIVLSWAPAAGNADEVILQRENMTKTPAGEDPAPRRKAGAEDGQGVLWLAAGSRASDRAQHGTLDASAEAGKTYTYRALRRERVTLGGRTLELRGEMSTPVSITLTPTFAPLAPTGLVAAAFSNGAATEGKTRFAVDLVWQPVDDADVAGYNVYRQRMDAHDALLGTREKLTATPSREPGFHDATALAAARYRYDVTAVDTHGNESGAVTTVVEPSDAP